MSENKSSARNESRENSRTLFVRSEFREEFLEQLKGAPLSVLCAYCSYANKKGIAWPSLGTLATKTGYGIATVKAAKKTLIRIGLLTPVEQSRESGRFGRKQFQVCTVVQKGTHGTVGHSTAVGETEAQQSTQEVPPVEVPLKGKVSNNAVRRPVDAERPVDSPVDVKANLTSTPPFKGKTNPSRREKFEVRLAGKIESEGDSYASYITRCQKRGLAHPFGAEEQTAFKAVRYEPDLDSSLLSWNFVITVVDEYEKHQDEGLTPGNLCSKIIDHCMAEGYYWPPNFEDHRDRLRQLERQAEQSAAREVRA